MGEDDIRQRFYKLHRHITMRYVTALRRLSPLILPAYYVRSAGSCRLGTSPTYYVLSADTPAYYARSADPPTY